jgi:hypothetical protein
MTQRATSARPCSVAYELRKPGEEIMIKIIHTRMHAQILTISCIAASGAAEYYDRQYNPPKAGSLVSSRA